MPPPRRPSPPRIPEADVDDVVARAVELEAAARRPSDSGVDVADVKRAAREAGVDPAFVERAVEELDAERERSAAQKLRLKRVAGAICGVLALAGVLWGMAANRPVTHEVSEAEVPAAPSSARATSTPRPPAVTDMPSEPTPPPEPTPPVTEPSPATDRPAATDAPTTTKPTADRLTPTLLTGPAATAAAAALHGDWQLAAWLSVGSERIEVPSLRRSPMDPPTEAWDLRSNGRFRRSLGGTLAVGGRWTVTGTVAPPEKLAWLGADTWWLVALDEVTVSLNPLEKRGREWLLAARDGEDALLVYLGTDASADEVTMGGRFTKR